MADQIKLPKAFFWDHEERDLPTPTILNGTSQHVFIDAADPALPDLISDARHYASPDGPDEGGTISRSAKALLKALRLQGVAA